MYSNTDNISLLITLQKQKKRALTHFHQLERFSFCKGLSVAASIVKDAVTGIKAPQPPEMACIPPD
jgi:hypothetical protein